MEFTEFLDHFPGEQEEERDGYVVHCPAHSDSRPSLRVTISDRGKVLLKCRAGCETPAVLKAVGLTLRDLATVDTGLAADRLRALATSTDTPASAEDTARLAVQLNGYADALLDHPDVVAYAERRFGLSLDDMQRLGLGAATDLPGGPRLVVPFRDVDGVPRGFQARALASDATVRWYGPPSPKGASWTKVAYFPSHTGWEEVIIAEGPGDSLTASAHGYDTIGIRGAGLVSNEAVVDVVASMLGDRIAVIAGDGDPAGRKFAATLARGLLARGARAKVIELPDDLDLSDWYAADPAQFQRHLISAIAAAQEETSTDAALRTRDLDRYPLTDLGNAKFVRDFIASQDSGIRFSPETGFYLLDHGVWRLDRLDAARKFTQEAAIVTSNIARRLLEDSDGDQGSASSKRAGRWLRWATYSQSSRGIDAAIKELKALHDVATDVNAFDQHHDFLAVANGVVNLRTGELLPHDPSLLLTRRVNVNYNPSARAPRWERFLEEVFPSHPDLPGFIQRLVGYGITGRTDEQCFAVHWGTGANGKTVFTDTLSEVFEELTVTTPFSTFENRPSGGIPNDIAALKGARLVMASEGEQGRPMAEAVLKRVTGRDLISARFMHREFFVFRPTFLLMLASNFKPKFRGQDDGLWRRVKLIPWERYFAPNERDPNLGATLLGESEGILAWAVRGAVEWFRTGLRDPQIIRSATKEYRETSDALAGFIPGAFVIEPDAGRVSGSVLFDAYLKWADDENLPQRERWTRRTFFAALEERGAIKRRAASGMAFDGIRRVRPSELAEDPEGDEPAETTTSDTKDEPTTPMSGPSIFNI